MEIYPVLRRRASESPVEFVARSKWARLAQVNWYDRNSVDGLRAITATNLPDWNIDANVTYWCGSSLQHIDPAKLGRTNLPPWEYLGDKVPDHYKPSPVPQMGAKTDYSRDYSMGLKVDIARDLTPAWSVRLLLPFRNEILEPARSVETLATSVGRDFYLNVTGQTLYEPWYHKNIDRDGAAISQILPMRAGTAVKWLKRGADVIWENKKYVVKYGSRVLGPIGALGTIKDMYDFIVWVNEKGVFDGAKNKPRVEYNPSNGNLEYHNGDGTVTAGPPRVWSPRLEFPGRFG